jgi:lipoprotein-anchoring transpeptidase ErfK/SrfK
MPLLSYLLAGDQRLEQAASGGPSIKPQPFTEPKETIRRIQMALCELSYVFFKSFRDGVPDGVFGPDTRDAVVHFQHAQFPGQQNEWDGRLGRKTLAKLDEALLYLNTNADIPILSSSEFKPVRGPAAPKPPPKPVPKPPPAPRPSAARDKRIEINTDNQTLRAFLGKLLVYDFDCVTGDSSHPTDPGNHTIFRKQHPCRSIPYNVQMNFAQFFTGDGKAIHQYHGILPLAVVRVAKKGTDWFGSHGCVRLTESNAKTLFAWTPANGTLVKVVPVKKK